MPTSNERVDSLAARLDVEAKVGQLAALSPIEYDRRREEEAESLGIRLGTLDEEVRKARGETEAKSPLDKLITEAEPWHERVDGAALLDELVDTIKAYVVLPRGAARALALWILHTYCLDAFVVSPLLVLKSPEKRCGKTTGLTILHFLVKRAVSAANISPAVLFRSIEKYQPTLLIDEADTFLRQNDELRGVINSGHTRFTAFVLRSDGDTHEPKQFSTWGAKAIALIGKAQDTIMDRSVIITMRRKIPSEVVAKLRIDQPEVFTSLTRKCQRWADDFTEVLKKYDPDMPDGLNDRAADNWRPLVAIAELAGWREKADKALEALNRDDVDDESVRSMLLQDIKSLFVERRTDRLWSEEITSHLETLTDRPWPEWRHEKPITQAQLARLLKPFGIKTDEIKKDGVNKRGYRLEQFAETFPRYAPDSGFQNATPLPSSNGGAFSDLQSATRSSEVALQGATPNLEVALTEAAKPLQDKEGSRVAPENASEGAIAKNVPLERF